MQPQLEPGVGRLLRLTQRPVAVVLTYGLGLISGNQFIWHAASEVFDKASIAVLTLFPVWLIAGVLVVLCPVIVDAWEQHFETAGHYDRARFVFIWFLMGCLAVGWATVAILWTIEKLSAANT